MFIQSDGKKVLLKEQILYVCENVFCTVFANQRSRRGWVRPKCLNGKSSNLQQMKPLLHLRNRVWTLDKHVWQKECENGMASSNLLHCIDSSPNWTWHEGSTILSALLQLVQLFMCVHSPSTSAMERGGGRAESGEYKLMSLYPIINVTGCWAAPCRSGDPDTPTYFLGPSEHRTTSSH